MKFVMTPTEVAIGAVTSAIDTAIKAMETGIKTCGELSSDDAKQSDANKQYFADQARVYAEAIGVAQAIRREVSARKE